MAETPYAETEALLAVLNEDDDRLQEVLDEMHLWRVAVAEVITWAEVRVGDVVRVAGMRWTVTARVGDTSIALCSDTGVSRGGQPDPAGVVELVETLTERPDPDAAAVARLTEAMVGHYQPAVAALAGAGLKPQPLCAFSTGTDLCGSDQDVHPYIVGHRCGVHAPGKVRAGLARRQCKCGGSLPADAKRPENCLRCGKPVPAR